MEDAPFSLGLTYWPRQAGFGWWSAFDRGAVREELAHIAALGCDTVRLCLRWEDVQSGPERVNSTTLRLFERALDLAADARLRVVTVLFPITLGGALHLPRWVSHPDPLGELQQIARFGPPLVMPVAGVPVIYEHGYQRNDAHDLFRDQAIRDSQRYLIHEVVSYFGSHPALWAWQIGEGLERVRRPDSPEAVRDWLADMAEAVRTQHAKARVLAVASVRALTTPPGPRPEDIAATCDLVAVSADPPLLLGRRARLTDTTLFLYALASALAGRPVIVSGLGQPSAAEGGTGWVVDHAYGQPIESYLADVEQHSELLGVTLARLRDAGAPGVWLAAYADYAPELWARPPLDRSVRERRMGLIDSDGHEKPVAATVRAFAAQSADRPAGELRPASMIDFDPERYWRDPRREYIRLWREFAAEPEQ